MKLRIIQIVLVLIISCAASVFSLASASPVRAGSPLTACEQTSPVYQWCNWDIKVDFPGKAPRVIYTVRVGGYSGGLPFVIAIKTQDISGSCFAQGGGAQIVNGLATFLGGYYECKRPSFKDAVYDLTQKTVQLLETCTCKYPAAAFNGTVMQPGLQPIFSRYTQTAPPQLDGKFAVNSAQSSSGLQAKTQLTVILSNTAQGQYVSNPWPVQPLSRLWSGELGLGYMHFSQIQMPLGWFDFLLNPVVISPLLSFNKAETASPGRVSLEDVFLHWSATNSPTYQPTLGLTLIQTGPVTFYIGYDPASKKTFSGSIQNIFDDPGCYRKG